MKIDGLSMEQLVAFLHGIETSEQMLWIKVFPLIEMKKKKASSTLYFKWKPFNADL